MSQGLEPEWLALRLTDRSAGGRIQEENGMRPPTIAELAMAARIFPENLQAGVAITRGRNELQEFQHLTGCDGLPFCSCIEAAIRRRYPDELASLTEDAVCGALYSWVMAEFDDSPEGKAFMAELEEMRARRDDWKLR
jgi:hypothetical protein